jgi:hypothetical protein
MWSKIKVRVQEGWKAIVGLLIPIAFGAASESIEALNTWILDQGFVWGGIVAGLLSGVGIWLKKNRPPGSGVI